MAGGHRRNKAHPNVQMNRQADSRIKSIWRNWYSLSGALIGVVLVMVGCQTTPTEPYWSGQPEDTERPWNVVEANYGSDQSRDDGAPAPRDARTRLAVMEFLDSGEAADESQLDSIYRALHKFSPEVVLIYAHGWHNNSDPQQGTDKDLGKFDSLLSRVAEVSGKKTFGLYVGWRGELITTPVLRQFTLDNRRAVARRIGRGDDLATMVAQVSQTARETNHQVTVVAIGHSLGGCMFEKLAVKMLLPEVVNPAELPDLFYLINPADVRSDSVPAFSELNQSALAQRMYGSSRLLEPWVIAATSESDTANRLANPINGWLRLRFNDSSSGFTPEMVTHQAIVNDKIVLPSAGDEASKVSNYLRVVNRTYLEPVFFGPGSGGAPVQYRIDWLMDRKAAPIYWNFRLPESVVADHGQIYGLESLGTVISVLQMARSRREKSEMLLKNLPAGFATMHENDQSAIVSARRPPSDLNEILALQRSTLRVRGEFDGQNNTISNVLTKLDRELFHGPALRLPFNENNIGVLLEELAHLEDSGPLAASKATPWPGDWRRRYAYRIFNILQFSVDADGWTSTNIERVRKLANENPRVFECRTWINKGSSKVSKLRRKRFLAMIDRFAAEPNVGRANTN